MFSMFKRLQTAVHIVTDSGDLAEDCFSWEDEPVLTLNVNDLFAYVPSVPGISWERVADVCVKTVKPVYHAVQRTLQDDLDDFAQFMVELEDRHLGDGDEVSVCETAAEESLPPLVQPEQAHSDLPCSLARLRPLGSHKRRYVDPELDGVLCIPSSDPSIPSIVITPCPSQPRDRSCLVPYQDVSFGNRLAVPNYPVVNQAFPPLLPKPAPFVERWRFKDGHWWAVLPTPEEQITRGMFSRPMPRRRRVCVDNWSRHSRGRRHTGAVHGPSPSTA
ncbi:hypothetical protein NM688_g8503 [Phlebia brevispora]|uniref:Uncharacterized protein n=1 Tax=Phlebia brevispora TaxID=194682 RepID=A0ACC1RTC3_9APHY|nr:hypothetical protein NM688_g8503 [Phlebia brevispora]